MYYRNTNFENQLYYNRSSERSRSSSPSVRMMPVKEYNVVSYKFLSIKKLPSISKKIFLKEFVENDIGMMY